MVRLKSYKRNPRERAPERIEARDVGEIITRALQREGELFIKTAGGRTVVELHSKTPKRRITGPEFARYLARAPKIDEAQFRKDVDEFVDQRMG